MGGYSNRPIDVWFKTYDDCTSLRLMRMREPWPINSGLLITYRAVTSNVTKCRGIAYYYNVTSIIIIVGNCVLTHLSNLRPHLSINTHIGVLGVKLWTTNCPQFSTHLSKLTSSYMCHWFRFRIEMLISSDSNTFRVVWLVFLMCVLKKRRMLTDDHKFEIWPYSNASCFICWLILCGRLLAINIHQSDNNRHASCDLTAATPRNVIGYLLRSDRVRMYQNVAQLRPNHSYDHCIHRLGVWASPAVGALTRHDCACVNCCCYWGDIMSRDTRSARKRNDTRCAAGSRGR